jgi:hypothetical protein
MLLGAVGDMGVADSRPPTGAFSHLTSAFDAVSGGMLRLWFVTDEQAPVHQAIIPRFTLDWAKRGICGLRS